MKPVRAPMAVVMLAALLLSGCTAAAPKPAPDASTIKAFGDALAPELAWFDNVVASGEFGDDDIRKRADQVSDLAGVSVSEEVALEIVDSAIALGSGYEGSLKRTTVVIDGWELVDDPTAAWEVIDTGPGTVTVVYAVHYVRELEELGDDRWEQVVEYEVTFDEELANVTGVVIRDTP